MLHVDTSSVHTAECCNKRRDTLIVVVDMLRCIPGSILACLGGAARRILDVTLSRPI